MASGPLIMISVNVLSRSSELMGSISLPPIGGRSRISIPPCGGGSGWGVTVIMRTVLRLAQSLPIGRMAGLWRAVQPLDWPLQERSRRARRRYGMEGASKKQEPGLSTAPIAPNQREFLVEVYGPLFGAIGRLALPAPVRLSDFVNEREGFLRLTDVELTTHGAVTATTQKGPMTEYLINKTVIELICQPPAEAIERRSEVDKDYGSSLWQALDKMGVNPNSDLSVPKERQ